MTDPAPVRRGPLAAPEEAASAGRVARSGAPGATAAALDVSQLLPGDDRLEPYLSRSATPLAPDVVVQLSALAGNRAVAAVLQRIPPGAELPVFGPEKTNRELIDIALRSRDAGDVKAIRNLGEAKGPEKIDLISILVHQGWIGPGDETALETLWGSFGGGVLDQARANSELWRLSLEGGAELYTLPIVRAQADKFLVDVRSIAGGYLDANEKYIGEELKRLGVPEEGGGEGGGGAPGAAPGAAPSAEEQAQRLTELSVAMRLTKDAKKTQLSLRSIVVGIRRAYYMLTDRTVYFPVTFDPARPPDPTDANPPADRIEKARAAGASPETLAPVPYRDVKAQWDVLEAIMQGLSIAYPVVGIGMMGGDRPMEAASATEDPRAARAAILGMLTSTRDSIRSTRPKLAGSLAYELTPIHNQLFGGARGTTGVDWKDAAAQALAKEVLDLESTAEFWKTMGLSTLAAAAFILAEFATAGMATAALVGFGVGIGAGQAAVAWDKAMEMTQAARATTGGGTELLASGQAEMAVFEAALATAMVAVDALSAAKPLGRALSGAVDRAALAAGSKAGGRILEELAELAGRAPDRALVERAVSELGAETVAARTGRNAAQLLEIVGEESPIAARLRALAGASQDLLKLSPAEFARRAGNLAAEKAADPAVAEQVAALAVERFGPKRVLDMNGGWRTLSMTLGNESAAGKAIMRWRDGMIGDIEAFVRELPGGIDRETGQVAVKRTGSQGAFTNDFDVSLLGPHASKNRSAVRSFMAGRAGTTPDRLGELLLADFFTDPRRLHLYDQLDPALRAEVSARAEKVAEATILNKTLHDAQQAGNDQLVRAIEQQMEQLGVPKATFRPLSEGDRAALYTKIDDLHTQLEQAIQGGDKAAQKSLVQQIGDSQGLINATEGGGYFSGGATRQIVSLAEGLLAGQTTALPEHVYTALLDQLPKLNAEATSLLRTGFVATEDAVGAIKGVAKYGNRFRELMRDLGVVVPDESAWDDLAARLQKLLHEAKGEADVTLLSRLQTEAGEVERDVSSALGQFRAESQRVLMTLNRQAAMGGQQVNFAAIQMLVMATAKLSRTGSAIRGSLLALAAQLERMSAAAARASGTPGGGGAPEATPGPGTTTPAPTTPAPGPTGG